MMSEKEFRTHVAWAKEPPEELDIDDQLTADAVLWAADRIAQLEAENEQLQGGAIRAAIALIGDEPLLKRIAQLEAEKQRLWDSIEAGEGVYQRGFEVLEKERDNYAWALGLIATADAVEVNGGEPCYNTLIARKALAGELFPPATEDE